MVGARLGVDVDPVEHPIGSRYAALNHGSEALGCCFYAAAIGYGTDVDANAGIRPGIKLLIGPGIGLLIVSALPSGFL